MTSLELKYGPSCSGDTVTIPGIKVEIFILIRNDSPEVLSRTLVKKFNEMKDEMFVQIEKKTFVQNINAIKNISPLQRNDLRAQ